MLLEVSPTRMELLKLKKRHATAIRGHKLLKDKLDEFVRILIDMVGKTGELQHRVETNTTRAMRYFTIAEAAAGRGTILNSLIISEQTVDINIEFSQIFNIRVPRFDVSLETGEQGYAFFQTSPWMDAGTAVMNDAVKDIIELAAMEKAIRMIADEIQKTRRRVNALEYILIPNIEDTIRFITMKLEENDRNRKTQLMRIKDVVRAPMAQSSAHPGVPRLPR
ncbi:MAG TPA: V-type ATP synthase subunit D [Spirochaetota bacterium]|nr:V-type ATP synthase subunit D [Spirochaetota bacterium]HPQ54126.1 V-type ATP synthase subunit D [Spirochaetota bacterium]